MVMENIHLFFLFYTICFLFFFCFSPLFKDKKGKSPWSSTNTKALKCHVVVTNYEQFHADEGLFKGVELGLMLLDEGHRLKNDDGKLTRVLGNISVGWKALLTGTPLQNNIRELFNIMHFLVREVFF